MAKQSRRLTRDGKHALINQELEELIGNRVVLNILDDPGLMTGVKTTLDIVL